MGIWKRNWIVQLILQDLQIHCLDEIQKHEDVINEIESDTNFFDGVDDTIEKMYLMHMESLKSTKDALLLG